MGSAAVATPGCGAGADFPHSAASVAGASGNARRAAAAAPTMAPAPRLRRRFLRESDMAVLLKSEVCVGSYLNALRRKINSNSIGRAVAWRLVSGFAATARNAQRVTALHGAVARQDVEIAKMLLERGADPNTRQERGHKELAEWLAERKKT